MKTDIGFPSQLSDDDLEPAAYNRIEAARAARRFPVVLPMLGEGALSLATVRLLSSHLTAENHPELLAAAAGKSKREVEELLVRYFPRPEVPSLVRKLPALRSLAAPSAATPPTPEAAAAIAMAHHAPLAGAPPLVQPVPPSSSLITSTPMARGARARRRIFGFCVEPTTRTRASCSMGTVVPRRAQLAPGRVGRRRREAATGPSGLQSRSPM